MSQNKILTEFLYVLKHKVYEQDLCRLETKMLFNIDSTDKAFISTIKVNPAISPFLISRLQIINTTSSFSDLVLLVKAKQYKYSKFKVEYVETKKDGPSYTQRKDLCKQIGLQIVGYPNFTDPEIVLGITEHQGKWYFGLLNQDKGLWRNHNHRPYKYSASLNMTTAKALVNIAGQADYNKKIIDPCCGIGTVILEALFAGYSIVGSDINYMVAKHANMNLKYFNYPQVIKCQDISEIKNSYDVAIVDMPYGLYYSSSKEDQLKIIASTKRLAKKAVFIHVEDISAELKEAGFEIVESCRIGKGVKGSTFERKVWVCE